MSILKLGIKSQLGIFPPLETKTKGLKMRDNLNTYLTERFNYNPEIDTINDTKAKEELSSFNYQNKYKSFKNN